MNAPREIVESLQHWVRKAEHDLEAARRIMADPEGCPYGAVCFHCQQAAEKYVKCLLTMFGTEVPRTHDLAELSALLPPDVRSSVIPDQLASLNPYAVEVRYVDDLQEPQSEDALRALDLAATVRAGVRKLLPAGTLDNI